MKIEIKHKYTDAILFAGDFETFVLAIEEAVRKRASLARANLEGARLARANLEGANLYGANLADARLDGASLEGASLYGANLADARLDGASLARANLARASLDGANLARANLYGANLARASLDGANLARASLDGANLYGASLDGANLEGASFYGANLARANLARANLYGANGIDPHKTTPLLCLLEQPGAIRLYKLVTENGCSPYFDYGRPYEIWAEYSVDNACIDPTKQCGPGISLATLDWCLREHCTGLRVLIAEFYAEDIAAIPTCTDGKIRVHRCRIVGEKDISKFVEAKK